MKTKRAVIFLNGSKSDLSYLSRYIDKATVLIGCDGGTKQLLGLGYKPQIVIGDFDSFQMNTIKDVEIIRYSADKDQTDAELAILHAIKIGCKQIILAGLLGDRIDHLLANILLLTKNIYVDTDLKIIEGGQEIYLLRDRTIIRGQKGDIVSFIPINDYAQVNRSMGLKYDLTKYHLGLQTNLGVSNVMTKATAEIGLAKGLLLVIHQRS